MQDPLPALQLPTPKGRERSGDRTRRRLFETALAEFRRVGVTDASIGTIAETAGVSRPTFYFHFPTKDHVLLELQWSLEEPIAARMEAAKTLDDALAALVDGLVGALGAVADPDVFAEMVRVVAAGGVLFVRDLLRPPDERTLWGLVDLHAAGANDHQRKMFADSLHAALTIEDVRDIIVALGFPPESVRQTTDRHWTWWTRKRSY